MAVVLVVDDQRPIRRLISRWVGEHGQDTVEADSAEAALELMEEQPAAVAFCDVQMPGRGGLWLTAELRRRYPLTAVILATAITEVPASISMRAGVVAYVVKPLDRDRLIEALEVALKWREEAAVAGPSAVDAAASVQEWLDSFK